MGLICNINTKLKLMIDNYDKLPLGKFLELRDMDMEGMGEIDIQVAIISILSGISEDDIMDMPIPEYKKLVSKTKFLTTQPTPNKKVPNTISMDGKEYDVILEVERMSAGQYIDYQTYIGYREERYLPHILSTIIIPKGEKYGQTDLASTIKTIEEHLPISVAVSLSAFFLNKWRSLTKATLTYLILKMRMMMMKTRNKREKVMMRKAMREMATLKNSIKDGVGLGWQ